VLLASDGLRGEAIGVDGKGRSRTGAGLDGMWPRYDRPLKDVIFPR